jgi:hypothetical protein
LLVGRVKTLVALILAQKKAYMSDNGVNGEVVHATCQAGIGEAKKRASNASREAAEACLSVVA